MTRATAEAARFIEDAEWHPFDYDLHQRAITFAHVPRATQREVVFLDQNYLKDAPKSRPMPIASLDGDRIKENAGPVHFIFHTAFCCSTLLARALDIPGVSLGLREPGIVTSFAWHWANARQMTGALGALDMSLDLLSRPLSAGEVQIVKTSNICNHLLPEVMQFRPDAKILLVHSSLSEFLLAIAKRDMAGRWFARLVFQAHSAALPLDVAITPEEQQMHTDLQVAAQLWLMQMAFFNSIAQHYGPSRVRTISSEAFLRDKTHALAAAGKQFGLDLNERDWGDHAARPVFSEHAKEKGRAFDSKARSSVLAETRAKHAAEIDAAEQWARQLASRCNIPMTLGDTLLKAV